ncbi:hydroxymethylglutaryl-CoA lyase [Tabrizicola oligotrophica]|uniref:hydroxymethylglutaryl-CoA lyase n=1 Tax=Tabrizicola oligotrophica TaxID=2710650 RepID=A0A6M0QUE0_9RHOB|nr:hydroxymethylglutaryl-CoA lyase [Tabrizicola oligotrophica]NEY90082.1 hydroxymethylglutaryl-CoA lyase [Tabrizicola oligotrophica]
MPEAVTLYEMGPRDGLQNEARQIDTADKIRLVDQLSDCGFSYIEVTSFVSPKWVPQMADAAAVLAGIRRKPGVIYAALTPNLQGFERALEAGADEVAVFASASEGFSQRNINCSIAESLDRFRPVLQSARTAMIPVRGYVSCVTDCPYDGPVGPEAVAEVAEALVRMGCYQVSLGDTIGAGTPETIGRMLDAVLARIPAGRLAGHYHDTRGRALDNIAVSLDRGLRVFDSSVGGLGGCPFAPGAKGNVATEAVAAMLHAAGFETGLDLDRLARAGEFAHRLRNPT